MEYLPLFLFQYLNSFAMRNCFLILIMSINFIYSHAQVNDSLVNAFIDRYLNRSTTEYINSISEVNDSLYLIVVRNLCENYINRPIKEDTLFVQFNDIAFKNYLFIEKELNTLSVSDRFPNRNTEVFTINQALIDGEYCFISVANHSLDHHLKQFFTWGFIYYIFKKKEGKYFLEIKIERSF